MKATIRLTFIYLLSFVRDFFWHLFSLFSTRTWSNNVGELWDCLHVGVWPPCRPWQSLRAPFGKVAKIRLPRPQWQLRTPKRALNSTTATNEFRKVTTLSSSHEAPTDIGTLCMTSCRICALCIGSFVGSFLLFLWLSLIGVSCWDFFTVYVEPSYHEDDKETTKGRK